MGYGGVLKLVTSSELLLVTSKAKIKILKHSPRIARLCVLMEFQGFIFSQV